MQKILFFIISVSILFSGCSEPESISEIVSYDPSVDECELNWECDDNNPYTVDLCQGIPLRCVNNLMSCSEIGGIVCKEDEKCNDAVVSADVDECCLGKCSLDEDKVDLCEGVSCSATQECIKGYCVTKACAALEWYSCESSSYCPSKTIVTEDATFCCPVRCADRKLKYVIRSEIGDYFPYDAGSNSPQINFLENFVDGEQMVYKDQDDDYVYVSVWLFEESDHLNKDVEKYMVQKSTVDINYMEDIFEDHEIVGIKEKSDDDAEYIWNSDKKVVFISECDSFDIVEKYLVRYPSDFNTTYLD